MPPIIPPTASSKPIETTPLTVDALRRTDPIDYQTPSSPKDDGLRPAIQASASVALNYAGRVVLPLCAQALCAGSSDGCEPTRLVSTATTGFFAGDLVAQLAAGPLVRALPGARLLAVSTTAWAAVALATPSTLLTSPTLLVLQQALLGLCCGLGYPSAHKLLGEAKLEPRRRSTALSLVNSSAAWGSMAASLLTPLIVRHSHWRLPFYCVALCGLAASATLASGRGGAVSRDRRNSGSTTGVTGVTGVTAGMGGASALGRARAAAASAAQGAANVSADLGAWAADPVVRAMLFSLYVSGIALHGLQPFVPTLLVDRHGVELDDLGRLTAVPPAAQVAACFSCGWIADRVTARRWLSPQQTRVAFQAIATLGPAAALLLLSSPAFAVSPVASTALVTLWTGCSSFSSAGIFALLHHVARARAGELFVVGNICSKLGALLAAQLLQPALHAIGWEVLLRAVAMHYLLAAALLLPRMDKKRVDAAAQLFP